MFYIGDSSCKLIKAGILAITGMFNMWFTVGSNSALQLSLKDEYRGRVMSVYFLVYSGTAPIGYIFAGGIMDRLGASIAVLVCGMSAIVLILLLRILFNRKDNNKSPASN